MTYDEAKVKGLGGNYRPVLTQAAILAALALILPACGSSGSSASSGSGGSSSPGIAATFSDPAIETFPNEGNTHVPVGTVVAYQTDPPTSGNHYPDPQSGGFFDVPIAAGFLVHSMEHGGVIIYYNPTMLSKEQMDTLKSQTASHRGNFGQLVCVPRNDRQHPLILTAWTHRLRLTVYDQTRLEGFLTLFLGQGPESSPGADNGPVQTNPSVAGKP